LPLPPGVWIAAVLAILMVIVLRQTVFGRYIFAIGSNEATARLCGIRVQRQKVLIYTLGGLFFGLAGLMQMSRLAQGDPSVAVGLELDVIAAVVIGGASLSGGTGSILGSMIGALIMGVLRNGSNMSDWPNSCALAKRWDADCVMRPMATCTRMCAYWYRSYTKPAPKLM
jgi:ribose transport system permease protein